MNESESGNLSQAQTTKVSYSLWQIVLYMLKLGSDRPSMVYA
jgi:hypothetical protein